jgi:DNA-binding IclR family transcriptional regulator
MPSSIVTKILSLLTIISTSKKPMAFSELVAKGGMNKSTVHRLLAICIEEKLVQLDPQGKTYLLGSMVFDLVQNAHDGHDIQTVALDEMVRLHALFDGNVTIGVPNGMDVVYLRILESSSALGAIQRPGMREQVHCSASGKALMAFLPEPVISSKLSGYVFERHTVRTILDAETFKAALGKVRSDGFATNDREEYANFIGISAPIFNFLGQPIAALNIWAVHPHQTISGLIGWAPEVLASTRKVSGLIGGTIPK